MTFETKRTVCRFAITYESSVSLFPCHRVFEKPSSKPKIFNEILILISLIVRCKCQTMIHFVIQFVDKRSKLARNRNMKVNRWKIITVVLSGIGSSTLTCSCYSRKLEKNMDYSVEIFKAVSYIFVSNWIRFQCLTRKLWKTDILFR